MLIIKPYQAVYRHFVDMAYFFKEMAQRASEKDIISLCHEKCYLVFYCSTVSIFEFYCYVNSLVINDM